MVRKDFPKEKILEAMSHTLSVRAAARYLCCSYQHLKKWMKLYEATDGVSVNLFEQHKNPTGIGIPKFLSNKGKEPPIMDIIQGRADPSSFSNEKLKYRLLSEGYLKEECYLCGFEERRVLDYKIPLIFNFKDKNKKNYHLENVEVLCYNCYFLTIGNVFSDKQISGLEDYQTQQFNTKIDWEVDDYHLERLKELGLDGKNDDDDYDIIARE